MVTSVMLNKSLTLKSDPLLPNPVWLHLTMWPFPQVQLVLILSKLLSSNNSRSKLRLLRLKLKLLLRNKLFSRATRLEPLKPPFSISLRSILSSIRWKLKKFFKMEVSSSLLSFLSQLKWFLLSLRMPLSSKLNFLSVLAILPKLLLLTPSSMVSRTSLLYPQLQDLNSNKLKQCLRLQRMPLLPLLVKVLLKLMLQRLKRRRKKSKMLTWEVFSVVMTSTDLTTEIKIECSYFCFWVTCFCWISQLN